MLPALSERVGAVAYVARILGLDVGERRIGVAISDPEGRLAVPLSILERQGGEDDERAVAGLARAEGAEALVVGLPLSLDGSVGPQARRVQSFADRLRRATGLPVDLVDERLTSAQARRSVARGAPRRKRAGPSDDVAAAIILQSYLDRRRAPDGP
jgi:putative Holliday junction resolvase